MVQEEEDTRGLKLLAEYRTMPWHCRYVTELHACIASGSVAYALESTGPVCGCENAMQLPGRDAHAASVLTSAGTATTVDGPTTGTSAPVDP